MSTRVTSGNPSSLSPPSRPSPTDRLAAATNRGCESSSRLTHATDRDHRTEPPSRVKNFHPKKKKTKTSKNKYPEIILRLSLSLFLSRSHRRWRGWRRRVGGEEAEEATRLAAAAAAPAPLRPRSGEEASQPPPESHLALRGGSGFASLLRGSCVRGLLGFGRCEGFGCCALLCSWVPGGAPRGGGGCFLSCRRRQGCRLLVP